MNHRDTCQTDFVHYDTCTCRVEERVWLAARAALRVMPDGPEKEALANALDNSDNVS